MVCTEGVRTPYTAIISPARHNIDQATQGHEDPTKTHDDAVTKPLRMQHMLVRSQAKVPQHLHRLGILDLNMALLDHGLHEVLVHQLSHRAP